MHTGRNNWGKRLGAVLGLCAAISLSFMAGTVHAADPAVTAVKQAVGAATGACPGLTPCPPEGVYKSLNVLDTDIIQPATQAAVLTIGVNLVSYASERLAYELATHLVSAAAGQTPLIPTKSLADSWDEMGLDIVGEFLGSVDEQFPEKFGAKFSVCAPPNPLLQLNLAIGVKQAYQPRAPKCDGATIGKNWESAVANIVSVNSNPMGEIMAGLAQSLRPGQNELSYAINTNLAIQGQVAFKKSAQIQDYVASEGFKPLTDAVTGQVKTPAALVKDLTTRTYGEMDREQIGEVNDAILGQDWGELGFGIGMNFVNTLLNTLLSSGLTTAKSLLTEGLAPNLTLPDVLLPEVGSGTSPKDIMERLTAKFGGIKTTQPFNVTAYDALGEFAICPPGGMANRGINNCVMDASFLSAVSRARSGEPLTIRKAVEEGLLRGDWPLIGPTDTSRNQDPLCYTYGYCHGNLAKLRKARIISIGWEMAAASVMNTAQNPVTLQRALDAFDKCDTAPELCRLIDPEWILMYPESQCRAQANGEILSVKNSASRASSCVDVQSCVSRRADGSCEAYGYCVSEKNVWRFQGESCPAQFASCMSFTNRAGNKAASFLLNTVNYATCSDANAGCLWYALGKAPVRQGAVTAYDWAGGTDEETEKRLYLNGKAKQCSSAEAGCTELYVAENLRLNLIANGDLETDENTDSVPDAWYWDGTAAANQYVRDSAVGFLNSEASIRPSANAKLVQGGIALTPGAFHTFSAHLRGTNTGDAVQVSLVRQDGVTPAVLTGTNFSNNTCSRSGNNYVIAVSNGSAEEYRRYTCTFAVPNDAAFAVVRLVNESLTYDAVQLEVGEVATSFIREGYDQPDPTSTYLRVAPAYLGCTGAATDRAECKNYAQSCSAQDVGCSLYRPADGGPSVPATATIADQCPNECVGYAAFKQQASNYEQAKFPVSFIPTNARACDIQFAGCDSFTNLDAVARGGESVEYYTNLRACSKPEETTQGRTYFTWEGSDAAGYQLRTWQLLKEVNGDAPCTSWTVTNAGTDAAPRPVISCTSAAAPVDPSCDEHLDIVGGLNHSANPDCREFYDEEGVISYRLFSKTVTISAACAPYRKTVALESDCRATGGLWTAAGECRYLGIAAESNSCPANVNGCRAYTGGAGNNVRTVIEETFEPPAFQSDDVTAYGGATVVQTSESVATGGHSIGVVNAAAGAGFGGTLEYTVTFGKTYAVDFWAKGNGDVQVAFVQANNVVRNIGTPVRVTGDWKSFSVGPVDTAAFEGFDDQASIRLTLVTAGSFYVDYLRMTESQDTFGVVKNSWTTPASCDRGPGTDGTPGAGPAAPQYYLGCKAYTETKSNETSAFYQFTRLCSENVVGCQAFFDTRNSKASSGRTYNAMCSMNTDATTGTDCRINNILYCTIPRGQRSCTFEYAGTALPRVTNATFTLGFGPDTRIVRNDAAVYLVDNGEASCTEASMGCQEVGKPVFNQDRSQVTSYETAYVFDRPDEYKDTLCAASALFCAAWNTPSNGVYYFKDPGEQTCEYRTDVRRPDQRLYTGWFRKGTNEPCAANNVKAGDQYGIWRNGDPSYTNWVGVCNNQYDLCTEYVDATDTTATTNKGQSYTYLAKGNLSTTGADACNGQVSQRAGCILLNNTNILDLPFSAGPSYVASTHADVLYGGKQNDLRNPISCLTPTSGIVQKQDGTSVNLCAMRCAYNVGVNRNLRTGLKVEGPDGVELVGACLDNADCPVMESDTGRRITGTCTDMSAADYGPNYYHKNDSNMVRSVIRDRECAEWLACQSSYSAWDKESNKYVPICEQVRGYRDFKNGQHIDPVQDVSTEPISVDAYKARNLSWYGKDYSGYTIPGAIPIPAIKHLNINPAKWCQRPASENYFIEKVASTGAWKSCATNADCASGSNCVSASSDYRAAVVVGTCNENGPNSRGGECRVGSCSISGARCNQNTDCGATGGTCLIGFCQEVSGTECSTDEDCTVDQTATARVCDLTPVNGIPRGRCVDVLTPNRACSSQADCSGNQDCLDYPGARTGACFNNLCLTDIIDETGDGRADLFKVEEAEALSCRGYPEISSPFPQQIVSSWIDYDDNGRPMTPITGGNPNTPTNLPSIGSRPYKYLNGFDQVPVCTPVCDTNGRCQTSDACTRASCSYQKITYGEGVATRYFADEATVPLDVGICIGSALAGKACQSDDQCRSGTGTAGTCQFATRTDTKIGWSGYCLEYDTSIQLFGSQDPKDRPCLTWFPTDSVKGATDLFGKDLEAGYFSGKDDVYCAETDVYYDVGSNVLNYQIRSAAGSGRDHPATDGAVVTAGVACANAGDANQSACSGDGTFPMGKISADNIKCPANFFAVVTGCGKQAPFLDFSTAEPPSPEDKPRLCGSGDDNSEDAWWLNRNPSVCSDGAICDSDDDSDFPYICVPKLSFRDKGDGSLEPCLPPGASLNNVNQQNYASPVQNPTFWNAGGRTIYQVDKTQFNNARNYYAGCYVRGLTVDELYRYLPRQDLDNSEYGYVYASGTVYPATDYGGDFDTMGYYNLAVKYNTYLGCKNLVQTSSATIGNGDKRVSNPANIKIYNQGWTDRLWDELKNGAARYTVPVLGYVNGTERPVFGQGIPIAEYAKNYGGQDTGPQIADKAAPLEHPSYEAPMYERADLAGQTRCEWDDGNGTLTCDGGIGIDMNFELAGDSIFGSGCHGEVCSHGGQTTIGDNERDKVRPYRLNGKVCLVIIGEPANGGPGNTADVDCSQTSDTELCVRHGMRTGCTDVSNLSGGDADPLGYAVTKRTTEPFAAAIGRVKGLFLRALGVWQWQSGLPTDLGGDLLVLFRNLMAGTSVAGQHLGKYVDAPLVGSVGTIIGQMNGLATESGITPKPPNIASVGTCSAAGCKEDKLGRVSVNGLDAGIVQGSDGQKTVNVSFFAWADNEQMPLRRIIVDWGDAVRDTNDANRTTWLTTNQTGSVADDNFYKNRRGRTQEDAAICSTGNVFGNSDQACEDGYVNFVHDYVCDATIQTQLPRCEVDQSTGQLKNSPCTGVVPEGTGKCVYQPRVHLVDNWGWCTGTCPGGVDNSNQCFGTECSNNFPNDTTQGRSANPWVYYSGYVLVEPSK